MTAPLYYRAGIGFKSRLLFERAISSWKLALHAGHRIPAQAEWCARALYEIAETSFIMGRTAEAGLTYLTLLESYPKSELRGNAARNAFAHLADVAEREGGAWNSLMSRAQELFAEYGEGESAERLKMQEATRLLDTARYGQARKKRARYGA